ncbi:hypothetical protein [Aurantibacter sp.]|uniref:outer membrane beta-barrel protein n=1 Tax=Aurantibacter sp. TaxID=2807103 RepID=UPI0032661B93
MSKKNIDKLFQEKLKDFHEMPEEHVWDSISTSLDKKKSRKIIPFWWQLGGAAAILAVFFAVYNPSDDKNISAPAVTDIENTTPESPATNVDTEAIQFEESSENQIKVATSEVDEASTTLKTYDTKEVTKNAIQIASTKTAVNVAQKTTANTQLATTNAAGEKEENVERTQAASINIKSNKTNSIANNTSEGNKKGTLDQTNSEATLSSDLLPNQNSIDNRLTSVTEESEIIKNEAGEDEGKKSIFDEIEKQTEEEEEALAETSTSKWSVGANLAPVYFNSFGEGSSIDPSFNSNSKSGVVNMSYGLSVAYNVSNKLSVRSGVNKVNYGYNTNEVEFSPSLQGALSSRLNNVNYTESAENIAVGNKNEDIAGLANRSSDVIANNSSRNGVMAQEFGYIEVPVELDYALVENRFGVNLVGGVSTLFLTNNSVALNSSDEIIELGEANNLNSVNFSTNVGFGLNYKFSTKVRFNVEPVFKYQLGTFSDTSGSFNPFSVGVYSGLNFKF